MSEPEPPEDLLQAFVAAAHAWAALTHVRPTGAPYRQNACLAAAREIELAAATCLGPRRAHDWKQYALKVRGRLA